MGAGGGRYVRFAAVRAAAAAAGPRSARLADVAWVARGLGDARLADAAGVDEGLVAQVVFLAGEGFERTQLVAVVGRLDVEVAAQMI
jgi:hypothetical protein